MNKPMLYFNGRSPVDGRGHSHCYVCARSKAAAIRLLEEVFGGAFTNEINTYWSDCWGNPANEVLGEQTEEGVWLSFGYPSVLFKFVGKASAR